MAAWIWGMPWTSRRTNTGADEPGQLQLPIEQGQLLAHGLFEPCHTRSGSHRRRDQQADYQAGGNPRQQRQPSPLSGAHLDLGHHLALIVSSREGFLRAQLDR